MRTPYPPPASTGSVARAYPGDGDNGRPGAGSGCAAGVGPGAGLNSAMARASLAGVGAERARRERPLRRRWPRACSHYRNALMMSAKTLHPRTSTSRCSPREQRRRNPCNRRNTRAIAVRRLSSSRGRLPRRNPAAPRRPHGLLPQRHGQVPRLVARGRPVHNQRGRSGGRAPASPPRAAHQGGGGVPGRERADERRAVIRGNHMNLGGPAASGAAEGLGAGCVRAPVPAGWTLTRGLSIDRAARLRRTICSRCRGSKTRSSTPFFDQRCSRV